jgi:hypothetical protein
MKSSRRDSGGAGREELDRLIYEAPQGLIKISLSMEYRRNTILYKVYPNIYTLLLISIYVFVYYFSPYTL